MSVFFAPILVCSSIIKIMMITIIIIIIIISIMLVKGMLVTGSDITEHNEIMLLIDRCANVEFLM